MSKLTALIIVDELHCIETLQWQLDRYCPEVELLGTYSSPVEGLKAIKDLQPDILFLDVEMPEMTGFEMLEAIPKIEFKVIFTTAHDKFAVDAFKVSALDYLIKPIDDDELMAAVGKAKGDTSNKANDAQADTVRHLLNQIQDKKLSDRIYLPTMSGLEFVDTSTVLRCESDSNYTTLFIRDNEKITVSKTLKDIEEMLHDPQFFRVHNSHIVNLKEVDKYVKGDGGHLVLKDGSVIPVSRARKQVLLDYLQK